LSREALGIAMFLAGLSGFTFFKLINVWLDLGVVDLIANGFGVFAGFTGLIGLYFMHCIYRIEARPFWNHWQVLTSFFGTMFSLGAVLLGAFVIPTMLIAGESVATILPLLAGLSALGLLAEGIGLVAHAKYLNTESGEGAAAHYIQWTTFGKTYLLRNVLIGVSAAVMALVAIFGGDNLTSLMAVTLAGLATVAALLAGRALFYVLVIPTTMPGAFFWKNKGFEQHARDIGLAEMPQVGVVPDLH
jgi:DMSO reductase anchor subunit